MISLVPEVNTIPEFSQTLLLTGNPLVALGLESRLEDQRAKTGGFRIQIFEVFFGPAFCHLINLVIDELTHVEMALSGHIS